MLCQFASAVWNWAGHPGILMLLGQFQCGQSGLQCISP
jgi:hypothetical protein